MKIIHGLKSLSKCKSGCAVTIGNFDGFHKGHKKLIEHIKNQSNKRSLCSTIITFEPLPEEFFNYGKFKRLTRLKEKLKIFLDNDIDQVICLNFNNNFSKITATDFISKILIEYLDTKYLVIGEDFKFGCERKGDYKLLQDFSGKTGMEVVTIDSQIFNNKKISSSAIREALSQGNISYANKLLGREYSITGRITKGDSRGHRLGYPTANIDIYKSYPIDGIFVVQISMENNENHYGLASVGNKPTFSGKNNTLEVYIFNFNKNIYNQKIKVSFISKLRDQIKFENEDELIKQMDLDYKNALKFLEDHSNEL
ncbi:MAG: bifunctional riboflavin kinase/FAD synthetase [Pseudomonadota bacterium]|nr:bifunctional riboflavin kinase/FAD synthetase [Pseudomonadota bacterium]MED5430376.1 bifunctional riboflavin kinase/FAD synthetase [Pseudomonadota bacterium]